FSRWQQSRETDRARSYWLETDIGVGPRLGFVAPRPEPDGYVSRTASVSPTDLTGAGGASGFAVALTAIGRALRRYGVEPDVEVGLITSTRNDEVADELVGYFLNTIPFVIDHDPITVSRRLGSALAARGHPLAEILADRRRAGLPAAPPSIYVSYTDFTVDRLSIDQAAIDQAAVDRLAIDQVTIDQVATDTFGAGDAGSAVVDQRVLDTGSSVAEATIFIQRDRESITLGLEYRGTVLTRHQAERLLAAVDRELLASGPVGQPGTHDGDESRLVGPDPLPASSAGTTVVEQIFSLLEAGGTNPAVVCGSETVTWAELDRRSRVVALDLLDQGLQPGEPVVVEFPRSTDLVAGILGVLRAGGAYVPIDASYPDSRRELLRERSGARLRAGVASELVEAADRPWPVADRRMPEIRPDQPAYTIFTSGSTGEPKAVTIDHARLTSSTVARPLFYADGTGERGAAGHGPGDDHGFRYLMVSSPSFDSSVAGIFWTLLEGGTLVMPSEDQVHDVDALTDLLVDQRITHTLMVPTLYQGLLASMVRRGLVRPAGRGGWWPPQVIVAGEACPPSLVDQHYRLFPLSRLSNEYGPTEATVWATGHHVRPGDDPVPIGRPIAGTWLEIVGSDGTLRPEGVAGELVLGGAGVAAQHGETYATGDRAVVLDGTVRFLGRLDNQLNVGGIRV
ncbi:MAG: AMP-binding protein, partial [Acidimicrobiia bacterium]|nr:AMP-binding protein [Acidimicrobiia bacterium]